MCSSDLPVGHVVELVGPDRAVGIAGGNLLRQASGIPDEIAGIAVRQRRDLAQVRTADPQHFLLLFALRFQIGRASCRERG